MNHRITCLILMLVLCFCLVVAGPVTAENAIKVSLNGGLLNFDQPPILENGRTLVPMRAIFEALGAQVKWESSTTTVTGTQGSLVVVLKIGDTIAMVNGKSVQLDVPAKIVGGRTLVPLRFIAESLGTLVDWDGPTSTVTITKALNQEAGTATGPSGPSSTLPGEQEAVPESSDSVVRPLTPEEKEEILSLLTTQYSSITDLPEYPFKDIPEVSLSDPRVTTGIISKGTGIDIGKIDTSLKIDTDMLQLVFMQGSGTALDPYRIYTLRELNKVREKPTAYYRLENNIDAAATKTWEEQFLYEEIGGFSTRTAKGWRPILSFSGVFDGNGKTISNLHVEQNHPRVTGGLFDEVEGKISNLKITNARVITDDFSSRTGILASRLGINGVVEGCIVNGSVFGQDSVGGLVGFNRGLIKNSRADGVRVNGARMIGGLVGTNMGTIDRSSADATLFAKPINPAGWMGRWESFGGLVGVNEELYLGDGKAKITNSFATGSFAGYISHAVGGLVGTNKAVIDKCYTDFNLRGAQAGGLVGVNNHTIKRSYAIGDVYGKFAGGLVGVCTQGYDETFEKDFPFLPTIEDSYAHGNVTESKEGNTKVGGLVGWIYIKGSATAPQWVVKNSYSTGMVSSLGERTGGLIGQMTASRSLIINSYYDYQTSQQNDGDKGTPRFTAQLKRPPSENTFINWGLSTWSYEQNKYPWLSWQ